MRRRIEVLLGIKKIVRRKVCKSLPIHIVNIKTSSVFIFLIIANKHLFQASCYLLDSFFSSLPLPPATRSHMTRNIIAADLHKTKKIETTDYTDFLKNFLPVNPVNSVAKKINYKEV
jgi:hypothetical protein